MPRDLIRKPEQVTTAINAISSSFNLCRISPPTLPAWKILTVMSLYLGRITQRAPRFRSIVSRSPRQLYRLTGARSSPSFFQALPVRNANGLINKSQRRLLSSGPSLHAKSSELTDRVLPVCCPGCGAYAQTVEPGEAGYYSKTRKQTRRLLSETEQTSGVQDGETGEVTDLKTEGEKAAGTIQQLIKESEEETAAPKPVCMWYFLFCSLRE